MTASLVRSAAAPALIAPDTTRVLVPPGRLLTFSGPDAALARQLLEDTVTATAAPEAGTRTARIAAALVENGALLEAPAKSEMAVAPERSGRARLLVCVTAGTSAARTAEYLLALIGSEHFEIEVALDESAASSVSAEGLRWAFGIPVHEGLFAGTLPVHAALGAWADIIAVMPAGIPLLRQLASGRYSTLASATIASSVGRVALFSEMAAADLTSGPLAPVVADLEAEGFSVVAGASSRAGAIALEPHEMSAQLLALVNGGDLLIEPATGAPEPRSHGARPLRVAYGISGAIVAATSSAWLEALATDGRFEIGIAATPVAARMVAVDELRARYATVGCPSSPDELRSWADVVVVLPTAAELLCRAADGDRADVAALVATAAPLVLAPSMSAPMWSRRAVQRAVDTLGSGGADIVLPGVGLSAYDRTAPAAIGGIGVAPAMLPPLLRLLWQRSS